MRNMVASLTFASLLLMSTAWAQSPRIGEESSDTGVNAFDAFRRLSPGEQEIARALAASEIRRTA